MAHDTGVKCYCVNNHNPNPKELHFHHDWPLSAGGPDTEDNLRALCPTTHANVHELWRMYEKIGGAPPWNILRRYSNFTRRVVEHGRKLRDEA